MRKSVITATILTLLILLITVPAHTESASLSGQKICLDPGHGGSDPGAVYDDGTIYLEEADINLDVAYGLKALLEGDGSEVVMTRTDDSYKSNNDRYTFCNNEQATILVSVHTNSSTDSSTDGSLALYFHKDDKVLAQAIYDVMYPYLRDTAPDPDNFTSFGLDRYASGVLLKSDMPSAMMEPLFMSNPAEAEFLVTPIYTDNGVTQNLDCNDCRRAQIAQAIYDGIVNYVGAGGDSPPSVSITSPNHGDTVSGTVTVTADASDDSAVSQVEFFVDGGSIGVDSDGSDGWSASWDTTAYADGPHTVSAAATDTAGQTASDSITVTVDNSGGGDGISLTAAGYKVKGLQKADLEWSGATSTDVDVYRDGNVIATTANDGFYTDNIDQRGPGTYTYQVCEAGTTTCSNEATVTF
jgi:N-acetylmuramoyl-L-alanine amidase